jgi:hypothetical protein
MVAINRPGAADVRMRTTPRGGRVMRGEIDVAEQQHARASAIRLHGKLADEIPRGQIFAFVEAHRRIRVADLQNAVVFQEIRVTRRAFACKQTTRRARTVVAENRRLRRFTKERLRKPARKGLLAHARRAGKEICVRHRVAIQPGEIRLRPLGADHIEMQIAHRTRSPSCA